MIISHSYPRGSFYGISARSFSLKTEDLRTFLFFSAIPLPFPVAKLFTKIDRSSLFYPITDKGKTLSAPKNNFALAMMSGSSVGI